MPLKMRFKLIRNKIRLIKKANNPCKLRNMEGGVSKPAACDAQRMHLHILLQSADASNYFI